MQLTIEVENKFDILPTKAKKNLINDFNERVKKQIARSEVAEYLRNSKDQAPDMTDEEVNDLINEAKEWARNQKD